ncbi:hypothetical protein GCM10008905_03590 [Clostridium malenominatum]|uniref:Prepilin-type N-terminal cleavage/methylation domain-containing protein n=1 Tax=Clostridium malenominatum TaxID=1539 RepID=A0ABN1IMW6_9CLOT
MRLKKHKKAFTLVELLVVIAIIAILSAIIAPKAFTAIEKSKVSRTINDMKVFKTAALQYYADVGSFPGDVNEGKDPGFGITPSSLPNGWNGPYLDAPLSKKTAWSGTYDYESWAPTTDGSNNNANGVKAGIYITIHGVTEKGAEQLIKQSPFEVAVGNGNPNGIQSDDVYPGKKKVTLKISDWLY